jgi:hypothetical protein
MTMPKLLIIYLAVGVSADLLYLAEWWMLHTGMVGKTLQVSYNRVTRPQGKAAAIIGPCVVGILFPPYVLGGFVYFVVRVWQERARRREYGRS